LFACEEDGIKCSSEGAYADVEAKFFMDLFLKFTKEKCAIIIELSLNESNGISWKNAWPSYSSTHGRGRLNTLGGLPQLQNSVNQCFAHRRF